MQYPVDLLAHPTTYIKQIVLLLSRNGNTLGKVNKGVTANKVESKVQFSLSVRGVIA